MAYVMNASEFVEKLKDVALNYKTLYVMGCFGAPMNSKNRTRYCTNDPYNKQPERTAMINAASASTFGFDCVCLIKGILWGWIGNKNLTYGGAVYKANGVPDVNADTMFSYCYDIGTTFTDLEVGEALWTNGHIGIYIGDGLAVECTPSWDNCVQITACNCKKSGYHTRTWKKHGKLPYVEYTAKTASTAKKSFDTIVQEVIDGKWYTGAARRSALTKAGYDYKKVQAAVNKRTKSNKKPLEEIAKEVIQGKWGNGADRKAALTKAGYDYRKVQDLVNKLV